MKRKTPKPRVPNRHVPKPLVPLVKIMIIKMG